MTQRDLVPGKHLAITVPLLQTEILKCSGAAISAKREIEINAISCLLWVPLTWNSENFVHRPLVVFLHGSSARGDLRALQEISLPKSLSNGSLDGTRVSREAFVLSPLCPRGIEWKDAGMSGAVIQAIDGFVTVMGVDMTRVILTGISMGGLGTWMLAARYPEQFSALLPVCGGGSVVYCKLLQSIPIWFAHSQEDNVVAVGDTDKLVQTLQKLNAAVVRYTRFEESSDPAAQG